ncbi:HAMP domain-containing histidine kinase [Actinotalea ferrariae]|nr:HAMP domain-containing histidine kinase [Actinotalea ferrariae]
MTVAGGTAYLLQRDRVDELVDETLAQEVAELRTLAAEGVDPSTGAPFTEVSRLLYVAIQRAVPSRDEGLVAVVDGEVAWVSSASVPVRPERLPALVASAVAAQDDASVRLRTLGTATTSYRYATAPVRVAGDPAEGVLLIAVDRGAQHAELTRTYRTYALVALGSLVVLAVVGWVVAGRLLAPIRALRDTAQRISDTDLSGRIPVTGDDDLSDLARTANAMLDRLELAFTSQRRLLDDAGHELRTPLTIVRGHLEVMDPADPGEVAETRTLVLDEVDRMHLLVDDLVTLATADRPDFVQLAPVDVGRLTDDLLDKARGLGRLEWRVDARADVVALVDERRLTQAVLQLAANATKFAPAGSTARLATRVVAGGAGAAGPRRDTLRVTVADEGPGVPEADRERVFERFARGVAGRGVEGSGLGLPIVAAIAAAHGGTVAVGPTRPGAEPPGATFVLDLPLRPGPTTTDEEDR